MQQNLRHSETGQSDFNFENNLTTSKTIIKCSNCKHDMELIGITEKQFFKYYCPHCYIIIEVKNV